jgi:eukaryotic-like serine/threonine-protein kinase
MKYLCLIFSSILISVSIQAQPLERLKPGTWGGILEYGGQTTELFLEITDSDDESPSAFLTLPVTNFYNMALGNISRSDSDYTAGAIQFSISESGSLITGSFRGTPRKLEFRLRPVEKLPERKPPFKGESTASPSWTFKTGGPIWGDAATDGRSVFIGSTDNNLYSLDPETGSINWTFETNGPIFSRPLVNGDFIFILSDDGNLYKLRKNNGEVIWTFDTGASEWNRSLPDDDEPGYDTLSSAPVISGEQVFIGSPDGHIYSIDESTGEENWRFQTDAPVLSSPAVENGILYIGSNDHHLYAIETETGKLKWNYDTGQAVISSPAVQNGLVITGSRSADLFALDAETGEPVWTYFYWFSWVESSGVFHDDLFYIGSSDNQLVHAFNPADGQLIWSFDTEGSPWAAPAVTDETVFAGVFGNADYFIDHRGGFVALDRLTGLEKWRFVMDKLPGTHIYGVVSSPVTAGGKVFFGGLDGVVYGFSAH